MKITEELLNKIKANITGGTLKPVPANVSFSCDECAGTCGWECGAECLGSCGSTCAITCKASSGSEGGGSGW